mgnify:CR=1 FL=1
MRSKEAASGRFCRGKIIRQNSEIYLQEDKNMSLTVRLLLIATLLLSIVIPFGYFLIGQRTKKRYKRAIGTNVFFFFSTVLIAGIMLFAGDPVQAAEAAGNTAQPDSDTWQQHFQPVFPASVVVSPLQVQQVRLLGQSARIPVHLVSH